MPPPEVLVSTKSWCPYCARAKALLRGKGVVYTEVDVEAVPERRDEMIAASGRRTVPQIFIGARHIGGCDDLHELDAAGGLDPLLAG